MTQAGAVIILLEAVPALPWCNFNRVPKVMLDFYKINTLPFTPPLQPPPFSLFKLTFASQEPLQQQQSGLEVAALCELEELVESSNPHRVKKENIQYL